MGQQREGSVDVFNLLLDPQEICCPPGVCSEDAMQNSSNILLFKRSESTEILIVRNDLEILVSGY